MSRPQTPARRPLSIEPECVVDEAARHQWRLESTEVSLRRVDGGWIYERAGLAPTLHALSGDAPSLRFTARCPRDSAVARFDVPIQVPSKGSVDVVVEWPLEVVVRSLDGSWIDAFVPGRRRVLLGTVGEGRVLPASQARLLGRHDDGRLRGRAVAALPLTFTNRQDEVVTVFRVPIDGERMHLFAGDGRLALSRVKVTLRGTDRAAAEPGDGTPPPGYECVESGSRGATAATPFVWILDATRRSAEFPL